MVENANLENQDSGSKSNKIVELKMSVIGKRDRRTGSCMENRLLSVSRSVVPDSLQPTTAHQAPRSGDFPGKDTGMVCLFLLQERRVNERKIRYKK